jgi:pimeloyl-ACP methyl ester carboxylesterase
MFPVRNTAVYERAPAGTTDTYSPTIVFLHSTASSHRQFSRVIPHVPLSYRIVALDLPGHRSRSSTPFSLEEACNYVEEIIDHARFTGPVFLVGTSLGGNVALHFAQRPSSHQVINRIFVTGAAKPMGIWSAVAMVIAVWIATLYTSITMGMEWLWSLFNRTGRVRLDGSNERDWHGTTLTNILRVAYELTTVFESPRGVIPPTMFCIAEKDGRKSVVALNEVLKGLKERNSKVSGAVALNQQHR